MHMNKIIILVVSLGCMLNSISVEAAADAGGSIPVSWRPKWSYCKREPGLTAPWCKDWPWYDSSIDVKRLKQYIDKYIDKRVYHLDDQFMLGGTAFLAAVRHPFKGRESVLRVLLDKGVDIEQKDGSGKMAVSRYQSLDYHSSLQDLREFIDAGADMTMCDWFTSQPEGDRTQLFNTGYSTNVDSVTEDMRQQLSEVVASYDPLNTSLHRACVQRIGLTNMRACLADERMRKLASEIDQTRLFSEAVMTSKIIELIELMEIEYAHVFDRALIEGECSHALNRDGHTPWDYWKMRAVLMQPACVKVLGPMGDNMLDEDSPALMRCTKIRALKRLIARRLTDQVGVHMDEAWVKLTRSGDAVEAQGPEIVGLTETLHCAIGEPEGEPEIE